MFSRFLTQLGMLQTTQVLCSEEEVLCQIMWKCLQKLKKHVYMYLTMMEKWERWTATLKNMTK